MNPTQLRELRFPLSLLLTCIYQWMFWQEKMGLNVLIFSSLLIGISLFLHPDSRLNRSVWFTAFGSLLTAILVVVYNSGTAEVIHLGSMIAFFGFVSAPQLRSMTSAFFQGISGFFLIRKPLKSLWRSWTEEKRWLAKAGAYFKLIGLPLVILVTFAVLYLGANPRLADLYLSGMAELGEILALFSWGWLFFCLGGWLLIVGILFNTPNIRLTQTEAHAPEILIRNRSHGGKPLFKMLSLKHEYRIGVMTFALLNALLFVNNLVDIDWIWFGFEPSPGMDLTQFVHEGTYFLIISILLSMLVVLYFFRANLNFYPKNQRLKWLAYVWIGQNLILVISVMMRNYHYIAAWGLAYKRIGVFFFLLAVIFGLATLFLKVRDRMSAFYLVKVNGWGIYGILILLTLINWDPFIATYNLNKKGYEHQLDRGFLLGMSSKVIPILLENEAIFSPEQDERSQHHQYWLENKVEDFTNDQKGYSWLSWNLADARVKAYLESDTKD